MEGRSIDFLFEKKIMSPSNGAKRRLSYYRNIIKFLYYHRQASVAEIVKSVNLSQPLVAELLKELSIEGVIKDIGIGASIGGRPPKIYKLVSDYQFVIGLDINLHSLSLAIFNLNNEIIYRKDISPFELVDSDNYADDLIDLIKAGIDENSILSDKILAIALSLPGLVDAKKGKSITHLSKYEHGVTSYIESKLNIPVLLENDCKMMAMGEKSFGKAQDRNNILCLKVGSGIGLGIILDGNIYRGANGYAGEFGHILIDPDGELCHCGKIGCLETLCSGSILTRDINEALDEGQASILSDINPNKRPVNLTQIINAINKGDQFAIDQFTKSLDYLGKGLVTLIHLFNPEMIILGGKLANTQKIIIAPLESALNKYTMPQLRKGVEISCSELLNEASLLGTMAHTMQITLR
jgi:N-acetylglucosamine repressor